MEFQQGNQASSRVEAWNSAFLSSCKRGVRTPAELSGVGGGSRAYSRGATGEADLSSCCEGELGVPFLLLPGNQALS